MSYLVLARKYRPRRLSDLVGQEHVAQTLRNAVGLDRIHHAYLFTGSRGVGKTSAARILAMALSCERPQGAEPCGACAMCREITDGQSTDIVEIDGASNNTVDDARALREAVRYAPLRARRKVYIIDEVHMLSTSAFNALLKTIEEPPAHLVFILATTEVHKVPVTILSRVQRYDFKLVPTARLQAHLADVLTREGVTFEPDALRMIAREAGGSVRDALSLTDQLLAFAGREPLSVATVVGVLGIGDRRLLTELCRCVLARDPGRALATLAAALERGVDLAQLGRGLLAHLHDVELSGLLENPAAALDLTQDELSELNEVRAAAPAGQLSALFERWARAVDEASRAATPRLIYEMALVDLCFTEPLVPLGDLLARLEELEARLAGGTGPPRGAGPGDAGRSAPTGRPPVSAAPERGGWPSAEGRGTQGWGDSGAARPAPRGAEPSAAPSRRRLPPTADPETLWRGVLDAMMEDSPMVAAALERAAVERIDDDAIALLVTEKLQLTQIEAARERVEALAAEVTGRHRRLLLRQDPARTTAPLVPARAAQEADVAAEERRRRELEARAHPMVRKAQELFHAGIAAVKIAE